MPDRTQGTDTRVAWDAASYERLADPQFRWALEVLDWRKWRGDERVLDAGCGPGRVAEVLLQRHAGLQVVAVDRDPDMLAKARARLQPFVDRALVVEADLADLPDLPAVDVVVSTAVLHWVPDHDAAFRGFHGVLRPGGELLAQFGGEGNIQALKRVANEVSQTPPFAAAFGEWDAPWHFDTAVDTAKRLRQAGFVDVKAALQPKPTHFADREAFLAFCVTAPLRPYLSQLPDFHKEAFVAAVGDAWSQKGLPWMLDYVRLNVRAWKPG